MLEVTLALTLGDPAERRAETLVLDDRKDLVEVFAFAHRSVHIEVGERRTGEV